MFRSSILVLFVVSLVASEDVVGTRVIVEATAYCPCRICTSGHQRTADGTRTYNRLYGLAGDRMHFRLRSKVFIPIGQGVLDLAMPDRMFIVDDRGGALEDEATRSLPRIDVRFKHHGSATRFGRRLIVIVINPRLRSKPVLVLPPTSAEILHYLHVEGF